ncbi:hypothetical protein [Hyalangium rubrum]|uniref:Lipoprotein n=1 Tax=Hyalangium rubrum TaxID=3103134 RepID=A0ABU5GW88_9BACT|nr:hypothetical protein [Hyalangium sp. s54d21]MDY7225453.1 hypothetical protein [Hyalangium sp. s54d21]
MRRARMKARWLWLLVPLMAASCSDDPEPPKEEEEKPGLSACLDQPNALARPPSGQLPCELLPPGFSK